VAVYFFDSSALVKRYVQETGSAWVQALCQQASPQDQYIARIAGVEVISAIARRGKAGDLSPSALATALNRFHEDFARSYEIVEISPAIVARAMEFARRRFLRGYDAVQLAVASGLHSVRQILGLPVLTLVSADANLNSAAVAEGLVVSNPNDHL
jgi:uncharacterized protein